jgi:hypothetical protein
MFIKVICCDGTGGLQKAQFSHWLLWEEEIAFTAALIYSGLLGTW